MLHVKIISVPHLMKAWPYEALNCFGFCIFSTASRTATESASVKLLFCAAWPRKPSFCVYGHPSKHWPSLSHTRRSR